MNKIKNHLWVIIAFCLSLSASAQDMVLEFNTLAGEAAVNKTTQKAFSGVHTSP
ncbi:MAG: hypothetical protein GY787_33425 [Alteromonadales bacterium]|nr:hypothetical protein [Alteromonadales bacterium]